MVKEGVTPVNKVWIGQPHPFVKFAAVTRNQTIKIAALVLLPRCILIN